MILSWLDEYTLIELSDGKVAILLPKDEKKYERSFVLMAYHIKFLREHYCAKTVSESLRLLIDDTIKNTNGISDIIVFKESS